MACRYYKENKAYNSVQEMIEDFYKSNYQLKNAAIFSAEEIQASTHNKILSIKGATGYSSSTSVPVTDFIINPHPEIFRNIPGLKETQLLAPEFRTDERAYRYVLQNIDSVGTVDVSGLDYDKDLFNYIKSKPEFEETSDDKIIFILNKLKSVMDHEEKTKNFGTLLHALISKKILNDGRGYRNTFKNFFNDSNNKEIFGEYSQSEWQTKIDAIVNSIIDKVNNLGKPITEIAIDTGAAYGIKGKIDLIAIDTSGDAHIFEIKVSKTDYKNWDSAKKLTLDWQLAFYRQLLGQHINIDKTMLYTIPVYMPTLGNPHNIFLEEFVNRKSESGSGLNDSGRLTTVANTIMPRKVIVAYDPEREDIIKNDLHQLLGEGYKVKTNFDDADVDKIMESAKKRYERDKIWRKWNNFEGIDGIEKGYMESKNEAEFREMIEKYVAHVKTQLNRNVSILKDAMISAIKTNQPIKTSSYNPVKDLRANHLLNEYLNDDWDVITDIPETLPMGLILLQSKKTGQINVVSLSINQFLANSHIPGMNYGDLEYMKTLLFINQFKKELLPSFNSKLGEIIVYNPESGDSYYNTVIKEYDMFRNRMSEKNMENKLKLSKDNIMGVEDVALYNLDVTLRSFRSSEQEEEKIHKIFSLFENAEVAQMELDRLVEVQKSFLDEFPAYKEKSLKPEINFDDPKEMLLAMLQVAIVTKSKAALSGDFVGLSEMSLGFSDFKSLVAAIYSKEQAKYNKQGKRIQGIVQGLVWTTPDWVASTDLRNINRIMSTANSHIGEKMLKATEVLSSLTNEYYDKIHFSEQSRNWIGETQSKYQNMWLHQDGKVSKEFKTKNPYKDDLENTMTREERDYLKQMLFQINLYKLSIPENTVSGLDVNSLESISTNEKIKKAIEDGSYFEMPLIRREEVSRFKNALSAGNAWKSKIKPYFEEFNDLIDARGLQKEDIDTAQLQSLGFYEMYDVYGRQTKDVKAKILERHPVDYFEWNLDTIAHRIAFNKIRKQVFDKNLPIINSYLWWMKLMAGKQNEDISKQLEYVANQMKLSVFDEPIIQDEYKDFIKVVSLIKPVSTAAMLAFKPASMVKELTIGVIRGTSLAATQIYGENQFSVKDLMSAYHKLITIDNKTTNEFNLIDRINHMYRFANMDINTMAQKVQTDRRGLFRGTGRWMYACNTIPDYYNRLSLFLAKMIADGSYEAHSLVNGKFTYDPKKDGRFSYYLENREKIKDSQGRYIPKQGDEKYNKQRQHYLLVMQQLNDEYRGEGVPAMTESDLIGKAYSEKERASFKTFTDLSYGYYDKDSQSQANNLWWGITWLQFMNFWPGKMKMWFAKPTSAEDSPMGKFEQDYSLDENGNKELWWRKPRLDEEGEYMYDESGAMLFDITHENTGDPLLKWTGTAYEGLAYSVLYTVQDLFRLNFKDIAKNKARRHRVEFALADGVLIFLLLGLVKAMISSIIDSVGTSGVSGNLAHFASSVNNKVLNEYNIWNSTLGAINTEPAFWSWGKKFANDMVDLFQGDKDLMDVMTRNVGAAEAWKEYKD